MAEPRGDSRRNAPPWTTDATGAFVDWTAAPYSDGRGRVELVLAGEDPDQLPRAVRMQRIREFYLLTWRAGGMTRRPQRRPQRRLSEGGDYR